MNLEYRIVGAAKNSEEDLRAIYDEMGTGVYTLALSLTRSRKLAREVAVETFRRVARYGVTFDTDMDGQYWIADICAQLSRNSLKDPQVSASSVTKEQVENASALLGDALFGLGGDRGTMVLLKAVTTLKNADIASLCGYYSGSAAAEIRRGIANLAAKDENREKKEILSQLKKDAEAACPDYYDRILDGGSTLVSHVSHEAMYLSEELNSFSVEDEADSVSEREAKRKEERRALRIRVIAVVLGILLLGGIVAAILISASKNKNRRSGADPNVNVQYGNSIDMLFAGGKLYYRGVDGGIFAYDPADGSLNKIYDGAVKELVTDGTRLYFRSDRSKLFSVNTDGSGLKQLCSRSGTTLCFAEGRLYFSASDGIYSMPPEGVADDGDLTAVYLEEVEDAPSRNRIVVNAEGRVFFSGGADKGIYEVTAFGEGTALTLLYFDEVYYMTLWDGKLLFDGLGTGGIEMYVMDVDAKKAAVVGYKYDVDGDGKLIYDPVSGEAALSYSAAYCPDGDRLWYEGYVLGEDGSRRDIGIYVIGRYSDQPRLMLPIPEDQLHVTEMLSYGSTLYCFYSDGKPDGERKLVAYDQNDFSKLKEIFDVRRQ